jgi:hypothetical protein
LKFFEKRLPFSCKGNLILIDMVEVGRTTEGEVSEVAETTGAAVGHSRSTFEQFLSGVRVTAALAAGFVAFAGYYDSGDSKAAPGSAAIKLSADEQGRDVATFRDGLVVTFSQGVSAEDALGDVAN